TVCFTILGLLWSNLNFTGKVKRRLQGRDLARPVKFRLDHSNPKIVKQTVSPIKKKEEVQISSPSKMDIPKVEIQIRQFSISPNPSNGQFQLQFEAKAAPIILRIYNNLGQVIYYEYLGDFDGYYNHQIELQSQGVYFIRLEQNKQSFSRQFLIVKD
ncbi:MAG: T9SS type A sorting domain-containing protein, partial [Bacteroidota bacterium]